MTIYARCQCGALLQGPEEFAGKRALCPACGAQTLFPTLPPIRRAPEAAAAAVVTPERGAFSAPLPSAAPPSAATPDVQFTDPPAAHPKPAADDEIVDVIEFLDPPEPPPLRSPAPASGGGGIPPIHTAAKETVPAEAEEPWAMRVLEAMLDPKSIQWLLMIGGGLMVIGILIWLISLGIFQYPEVTAAFLGVGSLALLGAGWYFRLKTEYHTAGRAITFLACVVLPLNLWFYHAQGLHPFTLEEHLWIGGVICTLLYIATVYVLRDAIFMYAVEIGVTLTTVLILYGPIARFGLDTTTELSLILLVLALISIHLERAFLAEGEFSREEYGLPLFWAGHAQLAAALCTLLGSEVLAWIGVADRHWFGFAWVGNPLSNETYLAAGIWAAGAYGYLYSDIVVRRKGVYAYLAALCVLLCVATLLAPQNIEVIMIVLALGSVVTAMAYHTLSAKGEDERLTGALPALTVLLAGLPLAIGAVVHIHDTNPIVGSWWLRPTGDAAPPVWLFAAAMAIVMAANRVAAFLFEEKDEAYSTIFYVFSGGAALIGAATLLRLSGVTELTKWEYQAPILMIIPLAYLIAARLYRGRKGEEALGLVAHGCTAAIVISGLFSHFGLIEALAIPKKFAEGELSKSLLLALLFAETAVFYILAAIFRRRSTNIYFAALSVCLALWQLIGYAGIEPPYYTLFFAILGLGLHVAAFFLGLTPQTVYDREGREERQFAGPGLVAFQCATAILLVACIAAGWLGLVRLAAPAGASADVIASILLTAACSLVAMFLVPSGGWRQGYIVATVVLCAIGGLHLYLWFDLSPARKLELICVAIGIVLLIASLIGRTRRSPENPDDLPTFGLSLGAILVIVPLFIAMVVKRVHPDYDARTAEALLSIPDELALVTAAIVMLLGGLVLRIRATTLLGALALALQLCIVIGTVLYQKQLWMGAYLAIGGGLIFAIGVGLSMYRDRLLALPQQIRDREGVFQVLDWT